MSSLCLAGCLDEEEEEEDVFIRCITSARANPFFPCTSFYSKVSPSPTVQSERNATKEDHTVTSGLVWTSSHSAFLFMTRGFGVSLKLWVLLKTKLKKSNMEGKDKVFLMSLWQQTVARNLLSSVISLLFE